MSDTSNQERKDEEITSITPEKTKKKPSRFAKLFGLGSKKDDIGIRKNKKNKDKTKLKNKKKIKEGVYLSDNVKDGKKYSDEEVTATAQESSSQEVTLDDYITSKRDRAELGISDTSTNTEEDKVESIGPNQFDLNAIPNTEASKLENKEYTFNEFEFPPLNDSENASENDVIPSSINARNDEEPIFTESSSINFTNKQESIFTESDNISQMDNDNEIIADIKPDNVPDADQFKRHALAESAASVAEVTSYENSNLLGNDALFKGDHSSEKVIAEEKDAAMAFNAKNFDEVDNEFANPWNEGNEEEATVAYAKDDILIGNPSKEASIAYQKEENNRKGDYYVKKVSPELDKIFKELKRLHTEEKVTGDVYVTLPNNNGSMHMVITKNGEIIQEEIDPTSSKFALGSKMLLEAQNTSEIVVSAQDIEEKGERIDQNIVQDNVTASLELMQEFKAIMQADDLYYDNTAEQEAKDKRREFWDKLPKDDKMKEAKRLYNKEYIDKKKYKNKDVLKKENEDKQEEDRQKVLKDWQAKLEKEKIEEAYQEKLTELSASEEEVKEEIKSNLDEISIDQSSGYFREQKVNDTDEKINYLEQSTENLSVIEETGNIELFRDKEPINGDMTAQQPFVLEQEYVDKISSNLMNLKGQMFTASKEEEENKSADDEVADLSKSANPVLDTNTSLNRVNSNDVSNSVNGLSPDESIQKGESAAPTFN